jgi:hypothetical protein
VQNLLAGYLVPRPLGARATKALSECAHRLRVNAAHLAMQWPALLRLIRLPVKRAQYTATRSNDPA